MSHTVWCHIGNVRCHLLKLDITYITDVTYIKLYVTLVS